MNQHAPANRALAERLAREIEGEVLFDRFSRGRYATDASIYQIEPLGVVVPKTREDVRIAAQIARESGVPLLARGGATSQSGQTVGRALVIDFAKHLTRVLEVDREARTCLVEPGIVLDELNRQLKATGLFFPVDVSTASRATIGGMTGNNSCGTRSIRYGIMRDNVLEIGALLPDGTPARFGEIDAATFDKARGSFGALARDLVALGAREADHIRRAFPGVSRRVGGYLIDALVPRNAPVNLATLLCGSEGTLALSERVKLKLWPQPKNKALGICHFPTFRAAMEAPQHIVKLAPVAVEVVDRTLIELARDIAMFRPVMEAHVRGKPDALLLVEFAEDDQAENLRRLDRLDELMGDLGFPGAVVKIVSAGEQGAVWGVRAAGLNIMMSMKSEGKPVSFIEDCAVPLEHLADYTERLTAVFEKHGTKGTWYAHASVGCLHVRPVLNLKLEKDAHTMRAIAEEAFAMVKEYKGAHSGEHGDGLVRSEFHEMMYGRKTVQLFEVVKDRFDPAGLMNPGKIVRAPRMNDRTLFRYKPDYTVADFATALDWSAWPGAGGGFQGAVEMCNNNGECRKRAGAVMCPSYRVTLDEQHVTRGRANTLRLAISGQLGPGAFTSDEMMETLKLCVSCKACRRECPTGVDMARMKIEVLAARNKSHGLSLHDRLVAWLPRYAPMASRVAGLLNLREAMPGAARFGEWLAGLSARRPLPRWRRDVFRQESPLGPAGGREVVLFADTFNTYFEPDNLRDAAEVLARLGYRVIAPRADDGPKWHYASVLMMGRAAPRPLCCGRTFLAAGLVEEAKAEARRLIKVLLPFAERGVPIVGLEPSCLFTLKDEMQAMGLGPVAAVVGARAQLFETFLDQEAEAGRISAPIARSDSTALVHGHCHQKSFGAFDAVAKVLRLVDGLNVEIVDSSCCGMAGAFGYRADTYETSMAMGELSLLPAVRKAAPETAIVADGFSCRHQIHDGTGRPARHAVRILAEAMRTSEAPMEPRR
ncbi:MAG: FAD-binding and (Fe-S)-binding domain-containing protein [Hyphomicrobiaceae bacterium]